MDLYEALATVRDAASERAEWMAEEVSEGLDYNPQEYVDKIDAALDVMDRFLSILRGA